MHDSLGFFREDPIHRRHHLGRLAFSLVYAFHENFVLSLSHDEVVHGKGPLLDRMPGDDWRRFANLRLLYAWMWAINSDTVSGWEWIVVAIGFLSDLFFWIAGRNSTR